MGGTMTDGRDPQEILTETSFGEGDQAPLSGSGHKKKGIFSVWSSGDWSRKVLIVLAVAAIVFLPSLYFYKRQQELAFQKQMMANKNRIQQFRQKIENRKPPAAPNEFRTSPVPDTSGTQKEMSFHPGGDGASGQPSGLHVSSPSITVPSSGSEMMTMMAPILGNINRIEKMEEVNSVNLGKTSEDIGSLGRKIRVLEDATSRLLKQESRLEEKVSVCKLDTSRLRRVRRSPPLVSYRDSAEHDQAPVFQGWRVLGASGSGAILVEPSGSTHYVQVNGTLAGQRVVSIDSDAGYVKFANGEVLKP